ncbi:hypothetical protein HDU67_001911 [Dinochytrium kinnereticum]|nr:hypothetical protein HDU67_001911 [Dinochytrium kinnereticum]
MHPILLNPPRKIPENNTKKITNSDAQPQPIRPKSPPEIRHISADDGAETGVAPQVKRVKDKLASLRAKLVSRTIRPSSNIVSTDSSLEGADVPSSIESYIREPTHCVGQENDKMHTTPFEETVRKSHKYSTITISSTVDESDRDQSSANDCDDDDMIIEDGKDESPEDVQTDLDDEEMQIELSSLACDSDLACHSETEHGKDETPERFESAPESFERQSDIQPVLDLKLSPKPGQKDEEPLSCQALLEEVKAKAPEEKKVATIVDEHGELPDISSDYSDENESDSDCSQPPEEPQRAELKKPGIPQWAESPNLMRSLETQVTKDPDDIFGTVKPLKLEDVFQGAKLKKYRDSCAGNWTGNDVLTEEEQEKYKKRMGFA